MSVVSRMNGVLSQQLEIELDDEDDESEVESARRWGEGERVLPTRSLSTRHYIVEVPWRTNAY